jgi:phosphoribosylpyrophosphate synthetase
MVLRDYKDSSSQRVRERLAPRVAGLLGRFIALHGDCIARAAGERWDAVVTVPSGHGRGGPHPLEDAVRLVVPLKNELVPALEPGPSPVEHNEARDDGFTVNRDVTDLRVLLIDDVMTSGSALQSAASALQIAGARVVAAAPIGRYVKPDFSEHTRAMWDEVRQDDFSFDNCCLE